MMWRHLESLRIPRHHEISPRLTHLNFASSWEVISFPIYLFRAGAHKDVINVDRH